MLRRSFLAAIGLAPAALIPAPKYDGPLIRGITFDGVLSVHSPGVRIEGCTSTGKHDVPFRIVDPARA